tara:strand:- start:273 stop:419 length:147 start_codon:yes stop_codon:yes gene_type:complete
MRELTLGKMLLALGGFLIIAFVAYGPECDTQNADAPVCGETICVPLND